MSQINKNFQKILTKIKKFRDDRNWMQFHNPKDLSLALSIETSELLELFLWKNKLEVEKFAKDKKNKEEISDELADIFNFAIELADNLGIDIEKAQAKKMEKNAKKYPIEKSRGSAKKYSKF